MTLLERTKGLHQRIEVLVKALGVHEEEKELREFLKVKLAPVRKRLTGIAQTHSAFQLHAIPFEQPSSLMALAPQVRQVRVSFAQNPTRSTLVAPTSWPALQPQVDTAISSTDQAQLRAWSGFCAANVPAQLPDALERDPDVLRHSANVPLVTQYKKLHADLARRSSATPRSPSDIDTFLTSAAQMHDLLKRIDRRPPTPKEMPPSVQRFFEEISKAPIGLDQMPIEVWEWLRKHGRLSEFRVDVKKT